MTAMLNDTFINDVLKAAPITVSALAQGKTWPTLCALYKLSTKCESKKTQYVCSWRSTKPSFPHTMPVGKPLSSWMTPSHFHPFLRWSSGWPCFSKLLLCQLQLLSFTANRKRDIKTNFLDINSQVCCCSGWRKNQWQVSWWNRRALSSH